MMNSLRYVDPANGMPTALRTALCALSQPMTHWHRAVSIDPSSPRSDTVTASSSWVRSVSAHPRSISTPRLAKASVSSRSVSCCDKVRSGIGGVVLRSGQQTGDVKPHLLVRERDCDRRRWVASRDRVVDQAHVVEYSKLSGMTTSARERSMGGTGARSMIRTAVPCRTSSFAVVSPVGPAPTTSTGISRSFTMTNPYPNSTTVEFHYDGSTTLRVDQSAGMLAWRLNQTTYIAADGPCGDCDESGEHQHRRHPEQQHLVARCRAQWNSLISIPANCFDTPRYSDARWRPVVGPAGELPGVAGAVVWRTAEALGGIAWRRHPEFGRPSSSAIASSSSPMAAASAYRFAGSRAVAFDTSSSNCAGTPPITVLGGATSLSMRW